MKKTKIFMGIGSLALATAAFMAAKPAKKLTVQATGFAKGTYAGIVVTGPLTNSSNGHTAFFRTNQGSEQTLVTGSAAGTNPAYYFR